MKNQIRLLALGALGAMMYSCAGAEEKTEPGVPVFGNWEYTGQDEVYDNNPLGNDEFYNPILQGCYPDPSICRKGNDYYLVCSSFAINPGVPIFHSTDLVNWKQTGHVLERPSQLKVEDTGISAGIYAPTIRYNAANDTFYMITTQFAGGIGNMVVKTKDPAAGWSDPIKLDFEGIDPDIFFDDDGKAYIVHNDAPKKALYEGHRVIKMLEYDTATDKIIPGSDRVIVDGGVNIKDKPVWIEAPHLYKKNGKYYLMCAEGGTGGWHSEVIFKANSPKGKFRPAPANPILSQRHLPADRPEKVDWAGHADLVEGPDGKYYGVFLAIRPNEADRVNTGRETFILPVDWSGEFPVFEGGLEPIKPKLKMPNGVKNMTGKDGYMPNGNFTYTENFTSSPIDCRWVGVRGAREGFASATAEGLVITPYETNIKAMAPTSTLFYRQQHINFTASVDMTYVPRTEKDLAGMTCYQSEAFNYVFGVTKKGGDIYLVLQRTEKGNSSVISSTKIDGKMPIKLQVKAVGNDYTFSYATGKDNLKKLGETVSGDILSTNIAGGFTGAMIGLYATTGNDAIIQ